MMTNCGCSKINNEPYEFKIKDCDKPQVCSNCKLLPNETEEDWCRLMNKVICDFLKVIKQLECGIQPDIEIILEEISLIYMNNCKQYGVVKRVFISPNQSSNNEYIPENEYSFSQYVTKEYVDLLFKQYCSENHGITRSEIDELLEFYYNKQEIDQLYSLLSNIKHKIIADELPSELENNTVYFIIQENGKCKQYIYHNDQLYELTNDIDLSGLATIEYVNTLLEQFSTQQLKHIFITQEEYDALDQYDKNTLYFIIKTQINKSWVFGDKFPAAFSS